jgi:hypothetical protein
MPANDRRTPTGKEQDKTGAADSAPVKEAGGPAGPEPVRYGDWERKGIAVDF